MLDAATEQLATIAGQTPNVRRARKSIANFKLRDGMPVGVTVTLRRARMWEFLDRLTSIAIPRIRDFRGLNARSFDGRGNYSHGRARADHLPGDRLRRDRPGARPRRDHHDDAPRPTRRPTSCCESWACRSRREGAPGTAEPSREDGRGGGAPRGGPAEGRGRGGGVEELKEENPEAYETPTRPEEGEEGEDGEAAPAEESTGVDGQDFTEGPPAARVQVQDTQLQPLQAVRSPARVSAASSASAGSACARSRTRA